jgi:hypothetical protein
MNNTISTDDRVALEGWKLFLFYMVPGIIGAFVLLCVISQSFRESWFGPDYYTRSTPAYHGQQSRWHW